MVDAGDPEFLKKKFALKIVYFSSFPVGTVHTDINNTQPFLTSLHYRYTNYYALHTTSNVCYITDTRAFSYDGDRKSCKMQI